MKILLAIATLLTSFALTAEARVRVRYSEDYTCATVRNVVAQHGEALVYSHGRYAPVDVYDIAYANGCNMSGYVSGAFYVRTADSNSCYIGYKCVPRQGH